MIVDSFSFANVKAEQLYIKWGEKLTVTAQKLRIEKLKDDTTPDVTPEEVIHILKNTLLFKDWFDEIRIEKISYDDLNGSFFYTHESDGFLNVTSDQFSLQSALSAKDNKLVLSIISLKDNKNGFNINGDIFFNTNNGKMEFDTRLNILTSTQESIMLKLHGDAQKLYYAVDANQTLKHPKLIIKKLSLPKEINYWLDDAMTLESLNLHHLSGWLEYAKTKDAYLHLKASATANKLVYTYDKKLAPVTTAVTLLNFNNGILTIKPQQASSYGFALKESWLNIDLTKPQEMLNLHLLLKAKLDKNIHALLVHYGIKIPLLQTKGELDTNLSLAINLQTLSTTAAGKLYTPKAQIDYSDKLIDIEDATIEIKNSKVQIKEMKASYQDIASSVVDFMLDGSKMDGKLVFKSNKINLKDYSTELLPSSKPTVITYTISKDKDYLNIDSSTWKVDGNIAKLDAIRFPISSKSSIIDLPKVGFTIQNIASGSAKGVIDISKKTTDLDINLAKFTYDDIALKNPISSLKVVSGDTTTISTRERVNLDVDSQSYLIDNFNVEISQDQFLSKELVVELKNRAVLHASLTYNKKNKQGSVSTKEIMIKSDSVGEIYKTTNPTLITFANKNDTLTLAAKEKNIEFTTDKSQWRLRLKSLAKVAQESKILSKYAINNGSLTISKKANEKSIKFYAQTVYKHKLLMDHGEPTSDYTVLGEIDEDDNIKAKINDGVSITLDDNIGISATNIGFYFDGVMNFTEMLSSIQPVQTNTKSSPQKESKVEVHAKNSFVYLGNNRTLISDSIDMEYKNRALTALVTHNQGVAKLLYKDNAFYVKGSGFSNEFIQKLATLSKIKSGVFDFSMDGTTKEYEGYIHFKDSIIEDHKVLNNVLAFVNTVPALLTFSLPGYSKHGIEAKDAYVNFSFKNDIYTLNDIFLKSKEMEIRGEGEASIVKNSINVDLNLKTELGSIASKIPVVGYIFFDKKGLSTSLKITGKLDDPTVDTQVSKEIAVAPFNIIKRTFTYPFEMFK